MTTFGLAVSREVLIAQAVRTVVELAEDARATLKDASADYFRWACEKLTDSEQQEVLLRLQCGHSALKRADGCCMCDQHRIIRAELDVPVIAIHEAPCCEPDAWGSCNTDCPRVNQGRTA